MDMHNGGYQPGPNLPRPHNEVGGSNSADAPDKSEPHPLTPQKAETASKASELTSVSQPPAGQATQVSDNGQTPSTPPPMDTGGLSTSIPVQVDSPSPQSADDSDLIEQEWVNKAKAIVESTKSDPHKQNEEISKFKADYIKKRYNKQVKISDNDNQ